MFAALTAVVARCEGSKEGGIGGEVNVTLCIWIAVRPLYKVVALVGGRLYGCPFLFVVGAATAY